MRKGAYVALFVLLLLVIEVGATIFQPLGRKRVETAVPVVPGDPMIVVWKTTLTPQQVVLPYRNGETYNCTVDWGDGTATSTVTSYNDPDATHQYAVAGTYTSTISGQQGAWYFNNGGSKAQFMAVNQWGYLINSTLGLERAFDGCSVTTNFASPIDSRWSAVTSLARTWYGCDLVKYFPEVSSLSNVTTLEYTWTGAHAATNLPDVNTLTNVTSLASTWYMCDLAKYFPAVNALTKVTTLAQAWRDCRVATNFPVVSNLTKVTSLEQTWWGCWAAKSFPAVSALTNVTSLATTWYRCWAATNFPVVSNLTKVTSLYGTWWDCRVATNFPAVSNLTKVTTLDTTWWGCWAAKSFPAVNTLTNVTTLRYSWGNCYAATNFPAVSNLTKVTSLYWTYYASTNIQNTVQSLLGDCSWITGQVKNVHSTFYNCYRLKGYGMPLVTAITNSPGYPTGYTTANCFTGCTNLTDWLSIPVAFGGPYIPVVPDTNSMIVVWKTTLTTQQVVLPYRSGQTYNCKVVWGDGTATSTVTAWNDADATHKYAVAGTYTSTISGQQGAWHFNDVGSRLQLMGMNQWGGVTNSALGLDRAFAGCLNATHFASPIDSRWGAVTSLWSTFSACLTATNLPSVSLLTNVLTLRSTWGNNEVGTNFPAVSNLTKVTTLDSTWKYCRSATYFPAVNALTNVTSLNWTWSDCQVATSFPAVSNLTKVTILNRAWDHCYAATALPAVNMLTNVTLSGGLEGTWSGCRVATSFPAVSNLIKVTSLLQTWEDCRKATSFPAVSALTNVTSLSYTWEGCTNMQNTVQSLLGNCSWITGQVKTVSHAFYNCRRLKGYGMPLVTAITNSPGYPTGYTISDCFQNCSNLTDWATIPAAFK